MYIRDINNNYYCYEKGGTIMALNRNAFNCINYGLFLIGAAGAEKAEGCIVNSLHQITSSMPPKFSLTVNKSNETYKAIEASGAFSAIVLAKDTPKELLDVFGYKSGRVVSKFDGYEVGTDGNGSPYVKDCGLARYAFKVTEKLDLGSYVLYIAQCSEAVSLGSGLALTLDDHRNKGNATPPNATVERSLEEVTAWVCTICGYIAYKDELPEGYKCPICKAGKDKFVKK